MDDSSAVDDRQRRRPGDITPTEQARLLDLSNDAIIVRDVENRIIYWNHGATEVYGWTRDEAIGQDLHTLLRTEFELPLDQLIIRLRQRDRMEGEVVQVTRDGRRRTMWSRWALDRDADGQPGAILTTYNDITERKQVEAERERVSAAEHAARMEAEAARAEAEAALKIREQFLSIASHELRTPLTALIGFVHVLPTAAVQDPAVIPSLTEHITRQAQWFDILIGQMLDVARLQRGQFAIEPQPIDLTDLVRQAVEAFRKLQGPNTRHPLFLHQPDAAVLVLGDSERLEQVFQNLLSNAVKYSPAGGLLQVRVGHTATDAIVEVTDQGVGIRAADQARLFEAFYRVQNVGWTSSGFGLGLYIVSEIVQRHGGRIEVESTEGQGSTFRVLIPLYTR